MGTDFPLSLILLSPPGLLVSNSSRMTSTHNMQYHVKEESTDQIINNQ